MLASLRRMGCLVSPTGSARADGHPNLASPAGRGHACLTRLWSAEWDPDKREGAGSWWYAVDRHLGSGEGGGHGDDIAGQHNHNRHSWIRARHGLSSRAQATGQRAMEMQIPMVVEATTASVDVVPRSWRWLLVGSITPTHFPPFSGGAARGSDDCTRPTTKPRQQRPTGAVYTHHAWLRLQLSTEQDQGGVPINRHRTMHKTETLSVIPSPVLAG